MKEKLPLFTGKYILPMYDQIKTQFKSGKALVQKHSDGIIKRELYPKFHLGMYPLSEDFYHELNPYFLYQIYQSDLLAYTPVLTVKDGAVTFANFLLQNLTRIPKRKNHFLIHKDLVRFVPDHLKSYFSQWSVHRPGAIKLNETKKVLLFGFLCEQYLGHSGQREKKLLELKSLPKDAEVEIFLPIRQNPFGNDTGDNVIPHETLELIRRALPTQKVSYVVSSQVMDRAQFTGTVLFDLSPDPFIITDNYLHYHVASRGGSINGMATEKPQDAVFSFELSLHHWFNVQPLPSVTSCFPELLFYHKQKRLPDLTLDFEFQSLIKRCLT